MGPIGAVILRQACRQAAEWRAIHPDLHIAVNVSGAQFADPTFVPTVAAALRETGLDPGALWLEITETSLMADADATGQTLDRAARPRRAPRRSTTSAPATRRWPTCGGSRRGGQGRPDVRHGIGRSEDEAIIAMIVALARTLDLFVIAEGVETVEQLERSARTRMRRGAGLPWYGRPTPADQVRFGEPVATH